MSDEQAEDALAEVIKDIDTPAEVDLHEDRTRELRTPGFSRMRTDWEGPDAVKVAQVSAIVDNQILLNFSSAYSIMNEMFEIIREPLCDPATGEFLRDHNGFIRWARRDDGGFVEDWQRLTVRDRTHLIYQITTRIFEWEQMAADAWGQAMFAKAMFEERFATTFGDAPGTRPTVDDRTQHARMSARDERYFAIFKSLYSRKADAVVRSMLLLNQRLKDTTV